MTTHDQGSLLGARYEITDPIGGQNLSNVFLIDLTSNPCDGNMKMTQRIKKQCHLHLYH